jgi:hypothetical protein
MTVANWSNIIPKMAENWRARQDSQPVFLGAKRLILLTRKT